MVSSSDLGTTSDGRSGGKYNYALIGAIVIGIVLLYLWYSGSYSGSSGGGGDSSSSSKSRSLASCSECKDDERAPNMRVVQSAEDVGDHAPNTAYVFVKHRCPYCGFLMPVLNTIAKEYPTVQVVIIPGHMWESAPQKVNLTSVSHELVQKYEIQGFPTVVDPNISDKSQYMVGFHETITPKILRSMFSTIAARAAAAAKKAPPTLAGR